MGWVVEEEETEAFPNEERERKQTMHEKEATQKEASLSLSLSLSLCLSLSLGLASPFGLVHLLQGQQGGELPLRGSRLLRGRLEALGGAIRDAPKKEPFEGSAGVRARPIPGSQKNGEVHNSCWALPLLEGHPNLARCGPLIRDG